MRRHTVTYELLTDQTCAVGGYAKVCTVFNMLSDQKMTITDHYPYAAKNKRTEYNQSLASLTIASLLRLLHRCTF